MNLNMGRLRSQLILHEALKLLPYDDATGMVVQPGKPYRGQLTTGVGRNLDGNPLSPNEIKEVGHDARTKAITHDHALYLLDNDIEAVCRILDHQLPWWRYMDEIRARVLVDLCFNLGITRLLKFKATLAAMRMGDFATAAVQLKDSVWYNQVKSRGERLVKMLETGKDWTK